MPTTARSRVLAVLLAAVVLIGGANLAAYAANGKPLLLGKTNVETKKAVVKNTGSGPALHLKTQPGQAPLKVNRTKKVNKLNADLVDGHSAADLKTTSVTYVLPPAAGLSSTTAFSIPNPPPGLQQVTFEMAATFTDPASFFGCYLVQDAALPLHGITMADVLADIGYLTGSTHVDTTTGTWQFQCDTTSSDWAVRTSNATPSITFTSVDEGTTIAVPAPSAPRPAAPRLAP